MYTDIATKVPPGFKPSSRGLLYEMGSNENINQGINEAFFNDLYTYRGKYNALQDYDFFTRRVLYYYASSQNNLGLAYAHSKQYDLAENHYKYALNINPGLLEALNNLGTMYYSKNEFLKALGYFDFVNKVKPGDTGTMYNIGLTYEKLKDYVKAEEVFSNILKVSFDPQTANELGLLYYEKGEYYRAVEMYKSLLARYPGYAAAYYNLGLVYRMQKDFQSAQDCFNKYNSLSRIHN
jgi:tetratricopeptide (TPR) repeat protein